MINQWNNTKNKKDTGGVAVPTCRKFNFELNLSVFEPKWRKFYYCVGPVGLYPILKNGTVLYNIFKFKYNFFILDFWRKNYSKRWILFVNKLNRFGGI
jgi:hypothetical protein